MVVVRGENRREREDRARAYRDQVKPNEEKREFRQGLMQQNSEV